MAEKAAEQENFEAKEVFGGGRGVMMTHSVHMKEFGKQTNVGNVLTFKLRNKLQLIIMGHLVLQVKFNKLLS